jgi:cold shock CspA family protein
MLTGTVVGHAGQGCFFIEQDQTRDRIFCHQRHVVREKYLHLKDRVRFNIAPNPKRPGDEMAVDVEIIWPIIARQITDKSESSKTDARRAIAKEQSPSGETTAVQK